MSIETRNINKKRKIEDNTHKEIVNSEIAKLSEETIGSYIKRKNLDLTTYMDKVLIQIQDYNVIQYWIANKKEFEHAQKHDQYMVIPYYDGYGELVDGYGQRLASIFKEVVTDDPIEMSILVKNMQYKINKSSRFFMPANKN